VELGKIGRLANAVDMPINFSKLNSCFIWLLFVNVIYLINKLGINKVRTLMVKPDSGGFAGKTELAGPNKSGRGARFI
jgi:hypothetical protein